VLLASVGALVVLLPSSGRNNGVHLAVSPQCGVLVGNTSDVNAGLNLLKYKTIVSFGVSGSGLPNNFI
jgi:hypothetical protein